MKKGLVIGKFLPVHTGHVALIRFAASQCDEVIVSMSYLPTDNIDYQLRFLWLEQIFKDQPQIKLELTLDNFDDPSLELHERTALWAEYIRIRFPGIDAIFSSEAYGDPLAGHLGVTHIAFDPARAAFPVSATLIRQNPQSYWSFIPDIVRPYFARKICFYGPESTGKSTMAKKFAASFHTAFVPEVSRELITSNEFSVDDIIRIGLAQTERVIEQSKKSNGILFCDTDVITTQIYSQHYLHKVPDILYMLENEITYERYFLFDIDMPWVADDIRDLGDKREAMMVVFKQALEQRNISWCLVSGSIPQREKIILDELTRMGLSVPI